MAKHFPRKPQIIVCGDLVTIDGILCLPSFLPSLRNTEVQHVQLARKERTDKEQLCTNLEKFNLPLFSSSSCIRKSSLSEFPFCRFRISFVVGGQWEEQKCGGGGGRRRPFYISGQNERAASGGEGEMCNKVEGRKGEERE